MVVHEDETGPLAMAEAPWMTEVARRGWSDGLPRALAEHGAIGGRLGDLPEDFQVDEVPAYLPCGTGEHVYLRLRKRRLSTPELIKRVARAFGVAQRDVGYAGLKDFHAVTTQWMSVAYRGEDIAARAALLEADEGLTLLELSRHGNKLRLGHLRGNRFGLRVVEGQFDQGLVAHLAESMARAGVLNYFGPQRFGRSGANVDDGLALLRRPARARGPVARLLVSAVQSAVFNVWAALRFTASGRSLFAGDLLQRVDSGGVFRCDDVETDSARFAKGEVVPTGPMPGAKALFGEGVGATFEREAAAAVGVVWPEESGEEGLRVGAAGGIGGGCRRPMWAFVEQLQWQVVGGQTLELSFELPPGTYATVVLRELTGGALQG